ncbi:MAG: DMT family transporter [Thermodesulfobacteriota bacterium]
MTSWIYLIIAILFEVAGTTSMKLSDGLTKLLPSILIFVFYSVSFTALTLCLRHLDVSVAYAVWSGLGTALIAAIGMAYFKEPLTIFKVFSIGLIVVGVICLNLSNGRH